MPVMAAAWLFLLPMLPEQATAQLQGDRLADVLEKGKGTIVLTCVETPGFAAKDASGKVNGVCVAIMERFVQYVEQEKGVKLTVKYQGGTAAFKTFYENVKGATGGVFGLGNATITEARKKEVRFSPPFISNITLLLSHKDVPTLTDLKLIGATFKGLTAYTVRSTTNEIRILDFKKNYFPDLQIAYVNSSQEALDKVASTPNSFTNLDFTYYLNAIQDKKEVKRHPAGDRSVERFGLLMPMDSDWNGLMKDFFMANGGLTASTEYKQILAQHLGVPAMNMLTEVQGRK